MGFTTKVTLDLPNADEIIRSVGLDVRGELQMFHTSNVLNRIRRFMPHLTGLMEGAQTTISTDISTPGIETVAPQVNWLFRGITEAGNPINYTTQYNPLAGPRWDLAVVAHDGDAMVSDLQDEVDRRAKL